VPLIGRAAAAPPSVDLLGHAIVLPPTVMSQWACAQPPGEFGAWIAQWFAVAANSRIPQRLLNLTEPMLDKFVRGAPL
jgi:hypothetical protein